MEEMKFQFGGKVVLVASEQAGEVVGYNRLLNCEPAYLVRYRNAAGDAVEQWWAENALEPAPA